MSKLSLGFSELELGYLQSLVQHIDFILQGVQQTLHLGFGFLNLGTSPDKRLLLGHLGVVLPADLLIALHQPIQLLFAPPLRLLYFVPDRGELGLEFAELQLARLIPGEILHFATEFVRCLLCMEIIHFLSQTIFCALHHT